MVNSPADTRDNVYILDDLTFIAHPRTASRAVSKALLLAGAEQVAGHHRIDVSRMTGSVVCVKRNMFDVLVSWWHNQNHQPGTNKRLKDRIQPFESYVHEKAYDTNHRWFTGPVYHYGLAYANIVIAYESLQWELHNIFWAMGLPDLERIGVSKRTDYHDYYSPELRAVVEDRWAEDLKLTGYSYETLLS
jgi:hypothetical protein